MGLQAAFAAPAENTVIDSKIGGETGRANEEREFCNMTFISLRAAVDDYSHVVIYIEFVSCQLSAVLGKIINERGENLKHTNDETPTQVSLSPSGDNGLTCSDEVCIWKS